MIQVNGAGIPQVGDIFVRTVAGWTGKLIDKMQQLYGDGGFSQFEHAGIVSWVSPDGRHIKVIEATPNGVQENDYKSGDHFGGWQFSTIIVNDEVRKEIVDRARTAMGDKYSFISYAAIAFHKYHIWVPGLKWYIGRDKHFICSYLADWAWQPYIQLFKDGRWPGYVTPGDLAPFTAPLV